MKSSIHRPFCIFFLCVAGVFFSGLGDAASAKFQEKNQPRSRLKHIMAGPISLDFGAGLRLRGELQDNFNVKEFGCKSRDEILLERLRAELGVHIRNNLRLYLQGQYAHELGCNFSNLNFPNGSPYNNNFDLRQAYLEWNRIGGTPMGSKLGRQSIAFTDNRLMGPGEWGNVGRYAWDAAALTWRSDVAEADLFYAFRVRYDPAGFDHRHFDYDVLGFFSTLPVCTFKLHLFYFLKMNNFPSGNYQIGNGSFYRHSPGISLEGAFDNRMDLAVGIVPQYGKWGGSSIRALGGYGQLGYTAPFKWSPRIGLNYAYGSGDPDTNDNKIRTFDGIFGAVDKYYGRMNLFGWMNLHNLQLSLAGRPAKNIKVIVDYHAFLLADKHDAWYYANGKPQRQDPQGVSGMLVGHELDIVVMVKATNRTQLQTGWGIFFPDAFVRNTGSHDLTHWGFLQWSYKF